MSDLNTAPNDAPNDGSQCDADKSNEMESPNHGGKKRKATKGSKSQDSNPRKKTKPESEAPTVDDGQNDSALSDEELHVQVDKLRGSLRGQKACNTRLNGQIAELKDTIDEMKQSINEGNKHRVKMEAHYQKQLATKSRPDARTTIMIIDHRQVVSKVKKTCDSIRTFAQRWALADNALSSNLSSQEKATLINLITGASDEVTANTMCNTEIAEQLLSHERAGRITLETLLSHWVCTKVLLHPFGFLPLVVGLPDNIEESLEQLYVTTSNTSEMRATTWRSVFAVCFDTAEIRVSDDNPRTIKEILDAREKWSSSLADSFLLSPGICVLREMSDAEYRRMEKQLVRLFSDFGYLATYLCSQGSHIKLCTWADISQTSFELESPDMELHSTMKMYQGEVYDDSSFQGRPCELLVCPRIEMYGRDGKFFNEGRTVLKSCHWFVQSHEHIKRDPLRQVQGDSEDNPLDLSTSDETKASEKGKISIAQPDDNGSKSAEHPASADNTNPSESIDVAEAETPENEPISPDHDESSNNEDPYTQAAAASEDETLGEKFHKRYDYDCYTNKGIEDEESKSSDTVETQERSQSIPTQ